MLHKVIDGADNLMVMNISADLHDDTKPGEIWRKRVSGNRYAVIVLETYGSAENTGKPICKSAGEKYAALCEYINNM